MLIKKYPVSFNYKIIYPNAKLIGSFEGGAIYRATKGNKYYLIIDEGTLSDFLDHDDQYLLDQLIKIIEFDKEENLNHYLEERYGRFKVFKE